MVPFGLKIDKDGLLYDADDRILMHTPLLIDKRDISENKYYPCAFYRLPGTNEYIVKYCFTCYTKKEIKAIIEMLVKLTQKQKNIPNVDFPIGYFKYGRRLSGQIIKYYENGMSYENILNEKDINLVSKYYMHDEDTIRNIFLIFDDVLNRVYEMFENEIYYMDLNPGNFILYNNEVKIIDFDPYYVKFDDKDQRLNKIMRSYIYLLNYVLSNYSLTGEISEPLKNFEDAKKLTKKIENTIQKNR